MSGSQILSIDVGGTFIDVLQLEPDGSLKSYKLPAVDPDAIALAIDRALGREAVAQDELLYSTTVTLNRLLAGDLPDIALIVTRGFRDVLETARLPQNEIQSASSPLPRRLVALEWVREIDARLEASGEERVAVDRENVRRIAEELNGAGIRVVAVALLHSYLDPSQEQAVASVFAEVAPRIEVICSSTVLPELREYERTLATALNACLVPVLSEHLAGLRRTPQSSLENIWLMQSNGGLIGAQSAVKQPLSTALSGPSAAVVGMRWLGEHCGIKDLITLDVGGTSTDVALIRNGQYSLSTAGAVAGFPLKTPMLDVLSIGAGGGSIAREAADRRWHVGPESAGATPGPACYNQGGVAPTLTDAQLVLGRVPSALLGSSLPLDAAKSIEVVTTFGRGRAYDVEKTARGILEIASHNMCGAIRSVSVARGADPAEHVLIAMGGAGPMHAAEVAELIGIRRVIVPPQPGLAAAWGLLVADVSRDFVHPTRMTSGNLDETELVAALTNVSKRARAWFAEERLGRARTELRVKLDVRYAGMTHTTTVDCATHENVVDTVASGIERFHEYFEQMSGRRWRDRELVELVNFRVTATGVRPKPEIPTLKASAAHAVKPCTSRRVGFLGHRDSIETPIFDRDSLARHASIDGPAIIEQYESTTVLPPSWRAEVDAIGNLILHSKVTA